MKILSAFPVALCLALLAGVWGCGGSKKKAPDSVAASTQDTMLLRDLAEANRNTAAASALDNSLNTVRTSGDMSSPATLDQTTLSQTPRTQVVSHPSATANQALTSGTIVATPVALGDSSAKQRTARQTTRAQSAARTAASGDYCDSPAPADQRSCLNRSIVQNDADLNRVYQDLIAQSQKSGGDELTERFRQSQRDWINTRDSECLQKTEGQGGPLWARPRARCLGDYSARRTAELQRSLNSLRGQ
jgi:uncharacterized protein YecT (DUF1311 family)